MSLESKVAPTLAEAKKALAVLEKTDKAKGNPAGKAKAKAKGKAKARARGGSKKA